MEKFKFTLSEENAIDLLEQTVSPMVAVALVAVDYNWGAPVSGRFDSDFLQIWAAARIDLHPRPPKLVGNYDRFGPSVNWSDKYAFERVRDCGTHALYFLNNALALGTEFVIMIEAEDGCVYYDNNGGYGVNYRLSPYGGRGTTAVNSGEAIVQLNGIVPIKLLWNKH